MTVLIRCIDGLTVDPESFAIFIQVTLEARSRPPQFLFQYVKAHGDIRHSRLQPFPELRSLLEVYGQQFLDHYHREQFNDIEELLGIWQFIKINKGGPEHPGPKQHGC